MKHFVGLDVSVKETSICVVDGDGEVVLQTSVPSEPRAIVDVLALPSLAIERIGLEAGPLSEWLYAGLVDAGLPAICVETRHMHAALSAQINKTDRNDALGIGQMMRVGLYKAVHVKTPASQRRRVLLTSRKLLQRKVQDLENELRGIVKIFGLKVGVVGKSRFEARVRELVTGDAILEAIVVPVLTARAALQTQYDALHRMVLDLARRDPICRRLMTAPGVGPVVALTYRTVIDNPARFAKSRSVGAHSRSRGAVPERRGVSLARATRPTDKLTLRIGEVFHAVPSRRPVGDNRRVVGRTGIRFTGTHNIGPKRAPLVSERMRVQRNPAAEGDRIHSCRAGSVFACVLKGAGMGRPPTAAMRPCSEENPVWETSHTWSHKGRSAICAPPSRSSSNSPVSARPARQTRSADTPPASHAG